MSFAFGSSYARLCCEEFDRALRILQMQHWSGGKGPFVGNPLYHYPQKKKWSLKSKQVFWMPAFVSLGLVQFVLTGKDSN